MVCPPRCSLIRPGPEWHYNGVDSDGNPILPSPNYLAPKAYQAPMAVRLGTEIAF